jgi:hypothetical protein
MVEGGQVELHFRRTDGGDKIELKLDGNNTIR